MFSALEMLKVELFAMPPGPSVLGLGAGSPPRSVRPMVFPAPVEIKLTANWLDAELIQIRRI